MRVVSLPSDQVPAPPSPKDRFDSGFNILLANSAPISLIREDVKEGQVRLRVQYPPRRYCCNIPDQRDVKEER